MDFKDFYKHIIFDIDKPFLQAFEAKQGDTKSRGFYVTVTQNNVEVPITTESMTFYCEKPDKTRVYQNAVKDGNRFRIDLANQVFAVPGILHCELTLKGASGERITSKTFKMRVDRSLVDNSIVSEDERGVIDDALEFVEEYVPRLELIDVDSLENYDSELKQNKIKISTVEKELSDYKRTISGINVNQEAKQEASGYGIVSLPKNAANGQVSGVVRGNTINVVLGNKLNIDSDNDGLADGIHTKSYSGGKYEVVNGRQRITALQSDTSNQRYVRFRDILKPNHKYYISVNFYTSSGFQESSGVLRVLHGSSYITKYAKNSIDNKLSFTFTTPSDLTGLNIISLDNIEPIGSTEWVEFENLMLIDLTENNMEDWTENDLNKLIFMDTGTKSTIGSARVKSVGMNIVNWRDVCAQERYVGIRKYKDKTCLFWIADSTTRSQRIMQGLFEPNTQYAISGLMAVSGGAGASDFRIHYTDGTRDSFLISSSDFKFRSKVSAKGKTIDYLSGTHNSSEFVYVDIDTFQIEKGDTATEYEPYIEDRAYVTAVKDGKIVNLRSLPNGVRDEIDLDEGKAIIRTSKSELGGSFIDSYATSPDFVDVISVNNLYSRLPIKQNWTDGQSDNAILVEGYSEKAPVSLFNDNTEEDIYKYYTFHNNGGRMRIVVPKGTFNDVEDARNYFNKNPITLIYQLAEPEIIPVQVSGSVVSQPSGTVYIDPATTVAGVYMDGIPVTHTDLPIGTLERITVIDYTTGLETELDVSQAVISEDKLLFTHPDLSNGDIVFFEYEYDVETTQGETTIQYYDSRYTIKDSVTGKFYKWEITVADGVPSIELVEV